MEVDNESTIEIMMFNDDDGSSHSSCSFATATTDSDENIYCTRGLENLRPGKLDEVDHKRKTQWRAVKDEQKYQRRKSIKDPQSIARALQMKSTHVSKRIAYLRALLDASIALQIHDDTMLEAMADKKKKVHLPEKGSRGKCASPRSSISLSADSSCTLENYRIVTSPRSISLNSAHQAES